MVYSTPQTRGVYRRFPLCNISLLLRASASRSSIDLENYSNEPNPKKAPKLGLPASLKSPLGVAGWTVPRCNTQATVHSRWYVELTFFLFFVLPHLSISEGTKFGVLGGVICISCGSGEGRAASSCGHNRGILSSPGEYSVLGPIGSRASITLLDRRRVWLISSQV